MATDFLNDVDKDNFVFIKTMPKKDKGETMLYFKQKKHIPVEKFTFTSDCKKDAENKTLLEVFTVDKGKYDEACESATIKPLNIDAVAGEKACYTVDTKESAELVKDFPKDTNMIIIGKSSLNIKFDGENRVSEVIIKNSNADNEEQIEQSRVPGTDGIDANQTNDETPENNLQAGQDIAEEHVTDTELNQYLTDKSVDNSTVILNNFSTLDEPTKKRVKEFIISDNAQLKIKELLTRLSSNDTNNLTDDLITTIEKNAGGKATRRRKRRGKKRSKNTRKKRKSKKARKSKR